LKISAPPQPTSASTWPIGTEAAICLISTSSSAKPAIEATISRLPRRLSITGRPSPDRGARHEFRQKKLSGSILLEKGLRLHFPVARPRVRRLRLYCRPQASIRGRPMRTTIHGARALSGLLLAAAVGSAAAQLPEWQTVTEERLLAPEPGDWLSYRRTYDVTAFSPLTEINRDTVRNLRVVWAYSMRDGSRWVATPIVANGLMYVAEGSGRVLAFDVATGELVWTHVRAYPDDVSKSEAYPRHRGVSIYGDTIYWGTADSFLVALDARTGQKLWETKTGDYTEGGGHAHPPLIADGKVFIGMSGGDFAARGRFQAFDAKTGEHLWTLYTTPRPGEPGYETWTDNGIWPPLGGATWNTVSYEPELELVYFSTGQPAPWTTASRGPGDSLYTNTLIAADADTGEIRWHFQLVPADQWDRSAYEGMLVDLEIGGALRKAVILTGKIGWGVVLDRATG